MIILHAAFLEGEFLLWGETPEEPETSVVKKSTLRLPDLKVGACPSARAQVEGSGLTLSGASLPRLQRRGLAPPNGSNPIIPPIPLSQREGCLPAGRQGGIFKEDYS